MQTQPQTNPVQETLLAALLQALDSQMHLLLHSKMFSAGQTFSSSAISEHCLLLRSGVIADLRHLPDGRSIMLGLHRCGDLLGMSALLNTQSAKQEFVVLAESDAVQVPLSALREALGKDNRFRTAAVEALGTELSKVEKLAICNRFHSVEERLADLLCSLEACSSTPLLLAQELCAKLLGVQRTSVDFVVSNLQRRGLVALRRGAIRIANHAALQQLACGCLGSD